MNILVIGNGFDLQHNLPTKYSQFIDYCESFIRIGKEGKVPLPGIDLDNCNKLSTYSADIYHEFMDLMSNFWINHFISKKSIRDDSWANFETEIENVVKDIYNDSLSAPSAGFYNGLFSTETLVKYSLNIDLTYKTVFPFLCKELKRLNRAIEIYMSCVVPGMLDITKKMEFVRFACPDKLLSFNYTDTFFQVYADEKVDDYEFVHGRAKANHKIDECNLVLGYDDHYYSEKTVLELVPFEKYYQRIINRTGAKYKTWLEKNPSDPNKQLNTVVFYGHSMSPADGDIIRELVTAPNTRTMICYRKDHEEERSEMIRNLAVVMTPTELIRLTGEPNPLIVFIPV